MLNNSLKLNLSQKRLWVNLHIHSFHGATDVWPVTDFSSSLELLQWSAISVGHLPTTPIQGTLDITTQEKVVGRQIWLFRKPSDGTSPHSPVPRSSHLVSNFTKFHAHYSFSWGYDQISCIVALGRWPTWMNSNSGSLQLLVTVTRKVG
jgi:hypothetical protein